MCTLFKLFFMNEYSHLIYYHNEQAPIDLTLDFSKLSCNSTCMNHISYDFHAIDPCCDLYNILGQFMQALSWFSYAQCDESPFVL